MLLFLCGFYFYFCILIAILNKIYLLLPMMVGVPQNPSNYKKKILFVDPDTMSYCLVCCLLSNYGIEIIHARCGLNVIRILRENPFIEA